MLLIAYEITIRTIENDYSYKNKWLLLNSKIIEVLAIGSSHCYCGIDPNYFSFQSFNAAHHSQSIEYDMRIFEKFYKEMDSLRYLIVTISYGDPIYRYNLDPRGEPIMKNYAIYYDLPVRNLKCNFEFINGIQVKAVIDFILHRISLRRCSERGFLVKRNVIQTDWQQLAKTRADDLSIDFNGPMRKQLETNYKNNAEYMEHIIKLCQERNIKVILLTTPIHKTFRDNINQEEWLSTNDFCKHFTQEFNNVSYLNFFDDSRFIYDDFYDSDHLNAKGAAKLSAILNEYLEFQLDM